MQDVLSSRAGGIETLIDEMVQLLNGGGDDLTASSATSRHLELAALCVFHNRAGD
jgi:hypothetical protein